MERNPIDRIRESDSIDLLASVEHARWAHWQEYLHSQCTKNRDGSLTIPARLVKRWEKQIKTPYSALSSDEKSSDIEQVEPFISALDEILQKP